MLNSKKIFPLLLLFLLIIPSFLFLLRPGEYWNMHDDMQPIRQLEIEKCLKDGQIPCRWTPDLGYGYGYPLFNFYPPLPYYVGQTFRTLGLPFTESIKYTATLQFIFAAFAMYLLAAELFGPLLGIFSALLYTYAPYHALNIYVRGAMNEAWASVFFPLIFYFTKKYLQTLNSRHLILFSVSFSLLLLSHNPMAMVFSPVLLVWIIFWMYVYKRFPQIVRVFLHFLAFSALSIGLSAYFTLPAILETKLVQIDSMFKDYYHFSLHFASIKQIFLSSFWGDGPSNWGPNDGMSFSAGYLHWIISALFIVYFTYLFITKKKLTRNHYLTLILSLMGFITLFMVHERSTFIWLILTPFQKIQFPWRFLNLSTFIFSLSAAGSLVALKHLKPHWRLGITIVLISALFALNISHFTPVTHGPVTDEQKFSGIAWRNQVTGSIYDYLPHTAPTAAKAPAKEYVDEVLPSTPYTLSGQKKGTDWQLFNIELKTPATVNLANLYFPEFKLYVDNTLQPITPDPVLGRISFPLSAGNHLVYLKLHNTPIRTFSNYFTLLSFGILIVLIFLKWKQPKSQP